MLTLRMDQKTAATLLYALAALLGVVVLLGGGISITVFNGDDNTQETTRTYTPGE